MDNKSIILVVDELMKVKGVTTVALVGRDGVVIESKSNSNIDMDALGAMVATAIGNSETLAAAFSFGEFNMLLSEYANGKIIMATAVNHVLAIFTDETAVIGNVRYSVKMHLSDVISALQ